MSYKPPKTITSHPAVFECVSGLVGGSDYRHDVFLKDGYVFQNGRMAGCRGGFFNSAKDFFMAKPVRVK